MFFCYDVWNIYSMICFYKVSGFWNVRFCRKNFLNFYVCLIFFVYVLKYGWYMCGDIMWCLNNN